MCVIVTHSSQICFMHANMWNRHFECGCRVPLVDLLQLLWVFWDLLKVSGELGTHTFKLCSLTVNTVQDSKISWFLLILQKMIFYILQLSLAVCLLFLLLFCILLPSLSFSLFLWRFFIWANNNLSCFPVPTLCCRSLLPSLLLMMFALKNNWCYSDTLFSCIRHKHNKHTISFFLQNMNFSQSAWGIVTLFKSVTCEVHHNDCNDWKSDWYFCYCMFLCALSVNLKALWGTCGAHICAEMQNKLLCTVPHFENKLNQRKFSQHKFLMSPRKISLLSLLLVN